MQIFVSRHTLEMNVSSTYLSFNFAITKKSRNLNIIDDKNRLYHRSYKFNIRNIDENFLTLAKTQ